LFPFLVEAPSKILLPLARGLAPHLNKMLKWTDKLIEIPQFADNFGPFPGSRLARKSL
jgi:hypothetical protein